eukprot:COSAG05_NODE_1822_length_4012_cov_18.291592_4_plen_138_part_00
MSTPPPLPAFPFQPPNSTSLPRSITSQTAEDRVDQYCVHTGLDHMFGIIRSEQQQQQQPVTARLSVRLSVCSYTHVSVVDLGIMYEHWRSLMIGIDGMNGHGAAPPYMYLPPASKSLVRKKQNQPDPFVCGILPTFQ